MTKATAVSNPPQVVGTRSDKLRLVYRLQHLARIGLRRHFARGVSRCGAACCRVRRGALARDVTHVRRTLRQLTGRRETRTLTAARAGVEVRRIWRPTRKNAASRS